MTCSPAPRDQPRCLAKNASVRSRASRAEGSCQLARWSQLQRWMVALVLLGTVVGLGSIETRNPTLLAERQGAAGLAHSLARLKSLGVASEYAGGSPGVRLQMWRATGRLMLDHPLAGVGAAADFGAVLPFDPAAALPRVVPAAAFAAAFVTAGVVPAVDAAASAAGGLRPAFSSVTRALGASAPGPTM